MNALQTYQTVETKMQQENDLVENTNLKIEMFILLMSHPCEIINIAYSKTGKHGVSKMLVTGKDVFTEIKYEDVFKRFGEYTKIINVTKKIYFATNLEDMTLHILNEQENKEILIELKYDNLCDKVIESFKNMKALYVKILTYENTNKIIEIM